MNAILVCVDLSDILAFTLPYNRHHFKEMMVVTAPHDSKTIEVVYANECQPYLSNAFYANGAHFNKWAALENGLDALRREGWLCIMDADILWPKEAPIERYIQCGFLYTPRRRMMEDLSTLKTEGIPMEGEWPRFALHPQDKEFAGYTQIFHADDMHLGTPPWHQMDWVHAGGADSFFQAKWPEDKKVRPPFNVLHLGSAGKNWCGRTTPYLDGSVPEDGSKKANTLRQLIAGRRGLAMRGKSPYEGERFKT